MSPRSMRWPAAANSSALKTGAVSGSPAICRSISSSVVASNRLQSILARSKSLRERAPVGIDLSLPGLAKADDPSDRLSRGSAPGVDTNHDAARNGSIDDDSSFAVILPRVIEFDRIAIEQSHGDFERQPSL